MAYVYKHIRLDKNEVFYIGIGTTNDKYARSRHKSGRNKLWKGIVKKTSYKIEIIFEDDDNEVVKEKEIELIKLYGRIDLGTGTLANLTNGGDAIIGYNIFNCDNFLKEDQVKEIKYLVKHISALHICNHYNVTRPVIDNIKLGKTYTQVTEESICEDLLNKLKANIPKRKKTSKIVYRYDLNGKYIDSWESAREYVKQNDLPLNAHNNIYESCNGTQVKAFDYMWSYTKVDYLVNYDLIIQGKKQNKKKYNGWDGRQKTKILQFDLEKNLIKTWNSLNECAIETKFSKPMLCIACKNTKPYKEFYWKKGEVYV